MSGWNSGAHPDVEWRQDPPAPEREPFWNWEDLAVFLLLAVPSLLIGTAAGAGLLKLLPRSHPKALDVVPGQFVAYLLWFGALWLLMKTRYDRPFWRSLGWTAPGKWTVLCIAGGPALAIVVGTLGALLRTPDVQTPLKDLLSDAASLAIVFVFGVTAAPISEELAFRGFAFPLFERSMGPAFAILVTSIPFSLLHGPEYGWHWQQLVLICAAGAAFGWVRYRTRSTTAAAMVHATYNLTFFTAYIAQLKM